LDLLQRDLNEIERITRRFELSSKNFCCMVGVCNRSESEIKENIEEQLKHHLERSGFTLLFDMILLPDYFFRLIVLT
jgi:hypothetical protein